jgi:hypothetical protein
MLLFLDNFRMQKSSGAMILLTSIVRLGGIFRHLPIIVKQNPDKKTFVIVDGNHRAMLLSNPYHYYLFYIYFLFTKLL